MKLFVVTSGSYSDYGIRAVFLSEEKAKAYCAAWNRGQLYGDGYEVEEWETSDETFVEPKLRGLYEASMSSKGRFKLAGPLLNENGTNAVADWAENAKIGIHSGVVNFEYGSYEILLEADNPEQAQKIAQDKIAEARYLREVEQGLIHIEEPGETTSTTNESTVNCGDLNAPKDPT